MHDMLGLGDRLPKFVANFMQRSESIEGAFKAYVEAVKAVSFPARENEY